MDKNQDKCRIYGQNPYKGNFYEAAKYNGQRFVDWLLDDSSSQKLSPEQVNIVLTNVYQNFAYDPSRRTILSEEPRFGIDPEF